MQLTEEQLMIRDTARNFAQSELAPNADEWERAGNVPQDVLRKMGEIGLMGVVVPVEWGGVGADFVSYALALEEIAAGHAASSLCMCAFAPYDMDNVKVVGFDVVTNRPKVAAYRAPGAPISEYAVECVVDELAQKLEMDPVELR